MPDIIGAGEMSCKLLDRFRYFKQKGETFANGHAVYNNNRDWEDSYRQRLAVRQNCPLHARCELHRLLQLENLRQKRPRYRKPSRPIIRAPGRISPNHEPRGCPRGASYSVSLQR